MIAHVATVDEARGRVVLRVCRDANVHAVVAAARIAQAYQAQLESLFVEDEDVVNCAKFPFAVELSPAAGGRRTLGPADLERSYRGLRRRAASAIRAAARNRDVEVVERTTRNEPTRALAVACAEKGPWNIIVLAEPIYRDDFEQLAHVFQAISDTTGVVFVGRTPARERGPVVAVVDRPEAMVGTLRAAQRIAAITDDPVILLLAAETDERSQWLEGEVRLALADEPQDLGNIRIATPRGLFGETAAILHAIRRLSPGFVVARFGGPLACDRKALGVLQNHLDCPILIGRG